MWLVLPASFSGCRAEQAWPLWEAYTRRFLDGQGRVIDRSQKDRTTSEGEAYAMFFALVDDDRTHFDRLLNWTEANLAGGDLTLHLPAWEWGRDGGGEWKTLDANSASDADLWMAYSLMQAGRLWREPRYEKLGRLMALRMAKQEVVLVSGLGTTLAPGPSGFHPDQQSWFVNPSYMPLPVLAYMAKSLPQSPWAQVLESLPAVVGGTVSHGFAMDWMTAGPGGVHPSGPPAEPTSGVRAAPLRAGEALGSYDAIRVYLWLGIAARGTPGLRELLANTSGMADYMRSAVTAPLAVDAGGRVVHAEGPPGFSAALGPFLAASDMAPEAKVQEDRLIATKEAGSGLYGRSGEYYDQNLALFWTGFSERRYRFDRDGNLHLKWK